MKKIFRKLIKRRIKQITKDEKFTMNEEELKIYYNQMIIEANKERRSKNSLDKQDEINNELWLNGQ